MEVYTCALQLGNHFIVTHWQRGQYLFQDTDTPGGKMGPSIRGPSSSCSTVFALVDSTFQQVRQLRHMKGGAGSQGRQVAPECVLLTTSLCNLYGQHLHN